MGESNPGRGIIVTFGIVPSIARVDATICICFVDGVVADHLVVLDCLEEVYEPGLAGTSTPERSRGGAEVLKKRVGVMHSFCWSWKPAFLSFRISGQVRLVSILIGYTGGIEGCSWSTENLSTHLRRGLFTQRSMSCWQKKLLRVRCCEFVIVPNSKVCQGRGALGVEDDFGSAFCRSPVVMYSVN
jgi:hypothetical protein